MEPEYMIRKMEEKDLPSVAAIEKSIFSQPWTQEGFRSSLESRDTLYLVVEKQGSVVGYCGFLQALDEADITNVAVEEAYRGQGIALSMLEQLMELGKERGIRAYTLEVRKSNAAALHVYEKLGFTSAGIRKNFYDLPKEDAVIMWKY